MRRALVLLMLALGPGLAHADQPRLSLGVGGGVGVLFDSHAAQAYLPPLSASVYLRSHRFGVVAERLGTQGTHLRDLHLEYYLPIVEAGPPWHPGRPQLGLRLKLGRAWIEQPAGSPDGTMLGLALSVRRPGEAGPRLALPFEMQLELRATHFAGAVATRDVRAGLQSGGELPSAMVGHGPRQGGGTTWMLLYTLSFGLAVD